METCRMDFFGTVLRASIDAVLGTTDMLFTVAEQIFLMLFGLITGWVSQWDEYLLR
jgi:hypothetical protein